MGLREEFEQQGEWLFRWRSYIPLALFPLGALAILTLPQTADAPLAWPMLLYQILCIAISTTGLLVRCITVGFVPAKTSGRNTKSQLAAQLNTSGMYSLARHPLYLGNYLIILGIIMYIPVFWCALIFSLLYWVYYERIMYREEEFLRGLFGQTFVEWSQRTPPFIPHFGHFVAPELPFSLKTVLRREYSTFYSMITMFTIMEVAMSWHRTGAFTPEWGWLIAWACGTLLYLTLRTLKRKTRLLFVDGR